METITKADLSALKDELLTEIRELLDLKDKQTAENPMWIRSGKVKQMLGISSGTLFNLRVNAVLRHRKIGGSYFYNLKEVEGLFEKRKGNGR